MWDLRWRWMKTVFEQMDESTHVEKQPTLRLSKSSRMNSRGLTLSFARVSFTSIQTLAGIHT